MKKLLLVSLLALGATSFAAIEGNVTDVAMPITMKGNVVAVTSKNLMIESTTGGIQGNNMTFDFGDIVKPTTGKIMTDALRGTFEVYRPDSSKLVVAADATTKVKIGFDNTTYALTKPDVTIGTGLKGDLTLVTTLVNDTTTPTDIKAIKGEVFAKVEVESTATEGTFTNTSEKIYVKVEA